MDNMNKQMGRFQQRGGNFVIRYAKWKSLENPKTRAPEMRDSANSTGSSAAEQS